MIRSPRNESRHIGSGCRVLRGHVSGRYQADRHSDVQSVPAGYTLIEMIIATLLVGALMTISFGLMSMYSRFLSAGQVLASQQTLVRSVFLAIESDLQRVSIVDSNIQIKFQRGPIESDPAGMTESLASENLMAADLNASDTQMTSEPSLLGDLLQASRIQPPPKVSMIGSQSAMRLTVVVNEAADNASGTSLSGMTSTSELEAGQASPLDFARTVQAPEEGRSPKIPEYQTIIWQCNPYGTLAGVGQRLPSGLYRIQSSTTDLQIALSQEDSVLETAGGSDPTVSVDRTILETLLFVADDESTSDSSGDPTTVAIRPEFELIPEVVDCNFEYFNGSSWEAAWNSIEKNSLPVAIRMRLLLVSEQNVGQLKTVNGPGDTSDSVSDAIPTSPETAANSTNAPESADGFGSAELRSIPTRRVERIVLLQPITGQMPLLEEQDALQENSAATIPPQATSSRASANVGGGA